MRQRGREGRLRHAARRNARVMWTESVGAAGAMRDLGTNAVHPSPFWSLLNARLGSAKAQEFSLHPPVAVRRSQSWWEVASGFRLLRFAQADDADDEASSSVFQSKSADARLRKSPSDLMSSSWR
ncbi:hypothetical protein FQA47_001807 [Oryzias melastigma]|uniref:Uncharacterized protein n=1 Tax=Oryzias melastigma TaxID=30732 RepID=A0A834L047_ORYME|nr:hypothetical protein FQA47_001807 [Oryzias melastigma]